MQQVFCYRSKGINKRADGTIVTNSGAMMMPCTNVRLKTWVAPDYTMSYEENRELDANFLFQRMFFVDEDNKYCSFAVAMQGVPRSVLLQKGHGIVMNNIPKRSVMAVYEKSDVMPNILKKTKAVWGHSEDEETGYAFERAESSLYPTSFDTKKRITQMTVISRERTKHGVVFNAFDLKLAYDRVSMKPKSVRLVPPNWVVVAEKAHLNTNMTGRKICPITQILLAKFGIDSTSIQLPKLANKKSAER